MNVSQERHTSLRARRIRARSSITSTGTALDVTYVHAAGHCSFGLISRISVPSLYLLAMLTVTACVTHDRGHSVTHDCHVCASMSHVTTTSCAWSRFSSPSERRVRSRACHVDAKVVRARTPVRGGGRSEESACGRHLRRRPCSTLTALTFSDSAIALASSSPV